MQPASQRSRLAFIYLPNSFNQQPHSVSREVYLENCDTVIIFAVMFEISAGAVINQSELHYVIPGAKTFKVIILLNDKVHLFIYIF